MVPGSELQRGRSITYSTLGVFSLAYLFISYDTRPQGHLELGSIKILISEMDCKSINN